MIDWPYVGWSALWIVGLSLELATLGIAYERSGAQHLRVVQVLEGRGFQASLLAGMVLFSLGLAALSTQTWQRIGWAILCAGFCISLGFVITHKKSCKEPPAGEDRG